MREEPEQWSIDDLVADHGLTSYNRRLADKVLNALNQAISVGRTDVAEHLQQALRVCVDEEQEMRNAILIEKAEAWRAFVEARDSYVRYVRAREAKGEASVRAREAKGEASTDTRDAMEAMRGAYVGWSRM